MNRFDKDLLEPTETTVVLPTWLVSSINRGGLGTVWAKDPYTVRDINIIRIACQKAIEEPYVCQHLVPKPITKKPVSAFSLGYAYCPKCGEGL